jgi:hypothetical protein
LAKSIQGLSDPEISSGSNIDPLGFSTIVQAQYGSNLTTVLSGLDTTQTQWQMSARQLTDPGWSDPSTKTPYIGNNRVRTAFATNTSNMVTTISPGGDTWMLGQIQRSTISTCVYNSLGNFVQAIPPQAVNSSYLMYSSADGVSNTWIALINGVIGGGLLDTVRFRLYILLVSF